MQWAPSVVIGCMSGTSCDGIDAVAVEFSGDHVKLLESVSQPLGTLGERLYELSRGQATTVAEIQRLIHEFSWQHIRVIESLREKIAPASIDLIAVHGQTLFHQPPVSYQAMNVPLLAHALSCPVVGDMRAADIAKGGQGAPITPLADLTLFPGSDCRAIVNLGGFVNVTILDADSLRSGRDVCVANQLLNQAAKQWLNQAMDRDGAVAQSGHIHQAALADLRAQLQAQQQGRSLGSGDEQLPWLHTWRDLPAADALATLCQGIAMQVLFALEEWPIQRVILAGGGVLNGRLLAAFRAECERRSMTCQSAQECGIDPMWREAAAMAILGRHCALGQPITLPQVTGVTSPAPVAGCWVFPQGLP